MEQDSYVDFGFHICVGTDDHVHDIPAYIHLHIRITSIQTDKAKRLAKHQEPKKDPKVQQKRQVGTEKKKKETAKVHYSKSSTKESMGS